MEGVALSAAGNLYTDQSAAYDLAKNQNANRNVFKYMIGYVEKENDKIWRERKDVDREGMEMPGGTLAEINLHADLPVEAVPLNTKYMYDRVRFTIQLKAGLYKSLKQVEAEREQSVRRAQVSRCHAISIAHAMEIARSASLSVNDYLKLAGYTRHKNGKTAYKKFDTLPFFPQKL